MIETGNKQVFARTATSLVYQNGDQVYCKKNDSRYWKGLATVIGNEEVYTLE